MPSKSSKTNLSPTTRISRRSRRRCVARVWQPGDSPSGLLGVLRVLLAFLVCALTCPLTFCVLQIDILRQLDHPYIVSLKEVVVTSKDTYIVMELLSGGELFNRIVENGSFTEAEAASLFAQILLSSKQPALSRARASRTASVLRGQGVRRLAVARTDPCVA